MLQAHNNLSPHRVSSDHEQPILIYVFNKGDY